MQRAGWRWIYLFNAPAAVVVVAILLLAWPEQPKRKFQTRLDFFSQVDILGALLLLTASVLLVFAIQEAGALRFEWNSPVIITCLSVSGLSWCSFVVWIYWLNSGRTKIQINPILPLSAALKRPTGPAIL